MQITENRKLIVQGICMPVEKTSINLLAQNCSTKKYSAFIQEAIKILKDDFLA